MEFDSIHIVFENTEFIVVPLTDVHYLLISDIFESVTVTGRKKVIHRKVAKSLQIIMDNRDDYRRVSEYQDITHVECYQNENQVERYCIEWADPARDDYNPGQHLEIRGNTLVITVNKEVLDDKKY